jgi:hypothetical protein
MSKPIIRHCYNCEYCEDRRAINIYNEISKMGYCNVKYQNITEFELPRLKAIMCRHYKEKGNE